MAKLRGRKKIRKQKGNDVITILVPNYKYQFYHTIKSPSL